MSPNDRMGRSGTYARTRSGMTNVHRGIVILLTVACVILALVWFLFVSRYWSVTEIQTNELHDVSRGEVASTTYDILDQGPWKPWDRRNIFFIDPVRLSGELRDRMFLEQVVVDKSYPNVLRLKIVERQRSVLLATKDQLLTVDTNGLVTGDAAGKAADDARRQLSNKLLVDAAHLPLIVCDLPELASAGYQAAPADSVKRWITSYKVLVTSGIPFWSLRVPTTASDTARLKLDKGYDLVIDLSAPLAPQIETYKKFIQSRPKTAIHEYVDVRVPGKIYLK